MSKKSPSSKVPKSRTFAVAFEWLGGSASELVTLRECRGFSRSEMEAAFTGKLARKFPDRSGLMVQSFIEVPA